MKSLLLIIWPILLILRTCAQDKADSYPAIGEKCPSFSIPEIENYKVKSVSSERLIGFDYILDFWSENCGACIASFPAVNDLQKQFQGKVQFLMVSAGTKRERSIFSQLKKKYDLQFASCYDSNMINRFVPGGLPHIIYVYRDGTIKAITSYENRQNIQAFIENKPFTFLDKSYAAAIKRKQSYTDNLRFLIGNNGGADTSYTFRTILKPWKQDLPLSIPGNLKYFFDHYKRFVAIGVSIEHLYTYAFLGGWRGYPGTPDFGKYRVKPIIEIKDTSDFQYDPVTGKNAFCYSLEVPPEKATEDYLMLVMKNDLASYFGFNAMIEKREFPCFKLILNKNSSLTPTTKGASPQKTYNNDGSITLINQPISDLIKILNSKINYVENGPILNSLEGTENIDIQIDPETDTLDKLIPNLRKYGLDLVQSKTEMNVLVIRDRN